MAITLRDVALHAQLSQATVSRALGDYGKVSATAKKRALQAAEELGYRPNAVARALVSGSTKTIGLIVSDIENPFFATVARGLSDTVEPDGYMVLLANSNEDLEEERRAVNAFHRRLVDALVVAPASASEGSHLLSPDRSVPLALIDRAVRGLHVDTVLVDNRGAAVSCVNHLLSLGHRTIGVVSDHPEIGSSSERLRGYRHALKSAGVAVDPELVALTSPTRRSAHDAAIRLLQDHPEITAIFTTSNFMTVGVFQAIRELGLKVPEQLALVGFDDLDWTTLVDPPLTVVAQPAEQIGREVGQTVLARLRGDQGRPRRIRLKTRLIVRASAGELLSRAAETPVATPNGADDEL
ncbi:LacI family DNA-binding transcriptional regulator [Conexibacter sp. CPCC 206217]|uniref:LacI family DNA-binding transcriptional regulator n=1 Tax=Conexibacter sp. CPCC 206217 TaxID=3064574 RepID=UPI00271910E0|nr:LacI family DNA-binding transcriptional regulator [Conexibacter sp. CPCC 206217]MDO8209637.1 LacI family DNA-binding transcriptional regulator [Conexibacter sp. CPCC 206217]